MPGLNRTGPEGQGPRTGRKMGKCSPEKQAEEEGGQGFGRRHRFGRGRGFGWGRGFGRGRGSGRRPPEQD